EAIALLLEEHRATALELDRDRDQQHYRRQAKQREAADDTVEQPLHHHVPVGDRLVGDVEQRDRSEIGIGARAEAQLIVVRREPDIDRQHPQLLEHLQDAALGRDRQREENKIDAGLARELDQVVDGAELLVAADAYLRAPVAA